MLMQEVDPIHHMDRIEDLPVNFIVSSDDEFMSFDWTNIYFNELKGEKNLLIAQNCEHSMATGVYALVNDASSFVRSVASGHTVRPKFSHVYDNHTGEITVTIPKDGP